MKIYVFVDMEGISGISGSDFVLADGRLYSEGRRYYTWDVNACARGCFAAGADEVIVRDGHGAGNHLLWSELDSRLRVVQGATDRRMPCLEGSAGLILLGYHAMAGTAEALLEHTFSSASIQNMAMNGRPVGEIGIDAGVAADYGVPTIMVSGDDKACAEARDWIPGVITCEVKLGLTCQGAMLLGKDEASTLIAQTTTEAVAAAGSIAPMLVDRPVTIRKEMIERKPVPLEFGRPGVRVIDGRTYEATADTVEQAFYRLL